VSLSSPHNTSDAEQNRWFAKEVQPHESGLRAYLHHCFPSLVDADDVVQESFLRVLRARIAGKLRSPKGLLFRAAHNAAIDVFRRSRTVSLEAVEEFEGPAASAQAPAAAESVSRQEELDLLMEAIDSLPRRCREVLRLRKIHGLSHKEIALRMGISERTVNVQVGKGVRRCAEYLEARGLEIPVENGGNGIE
jgi:RNA polymerase sigma factor (sigma-70 family)